MKKLFLFSALALIAFFSARAITLEPQVEEVELVSFFPEADLEEQNTCTYCVEGDGGNMYCAEATSCRKARRVALELARD